MNKRLLSNGVIFAASIACVFVSASLCLSADIVESHRIGEGARDNFFMTIHYTSWGKVALAMLLGGFGLTGICHLLSNRSAP